MCRSQWGALLQTERDYNRSETLRIRNRFSKKIVDFVIEDRASGAILALVELDDRSHNPLADRLRDAMTASAGYRTIRLPAGRVNHAEIAGHLQTLQPQHYRRRKVSPFVLVPHDSESLSCRSARNIAGFIRSTGRK
jgi:very-short-patch-repair endonuclease